MKIKGIVLSISLALASQVASGDVFTDVMIPHLKSSAVDLGYTFLSEQSTMLREGETASSSVTMIEGRSYKFVTICDADCGDMDTRIFDENGNIVASETGASDFSELRVTPRWSGPFRVQVYMHTCSREPCKVVTMNFREY